MSGTVTVVAYLAFGCDLQDFHPAAGLLARASVRPDMNQRERLGDEDLVEAGSPSLGPRVCHCKPNDFSRLFRVEPVESEQPDEPSDVVVVVVVAVPPHDKRVVELEHGGTNRRRQSLWSALAWLLGGFDGDEVGGHAAHRAEPSELRHTPPRSPRGA